MRYATHSIDAAPLAYDPSRFDVPDRRPTKGPAARKAMRLVDGTSLDAGTAPMGDRPFVLSRGPKSDAARRWAERAWACYPPAAVLVAAVFLVGGCGQLGLTSAGSDDVRPQLAGGVTEAGDAERSEQAGDVGDAATTALSTDLLQPYPSDLPLVGTAAARATVMHGKNRVDLANLSKLPWSGGRVWLNRQYSQPVPYLLPGKIVKLNFEDFRDEKGARFPTVNRDESMVEQVELVLGDERARVRFGLGY